MNYFIKFEDSLAVLRKRIRAKYPPPIYFKTQHFYECMKWIIVMPECENICVDILPRIEKAKLTFLVAVNVENDVESTKVWLEKQIEEYLKELSEQVHRQVKDLNSQKTKILFLELNYQAYLHICN